MYNPELVNQLLGEEMAKLFDGTVKIEPAKDKMFGSLVIGDKLTFTFKDNKNFKPRQFVVK